MFEQRDRYLEKGLQAITWTWYMLNKYEHFQQINTLWLFFLEGTKRLKIYSLTLDLDVFS